METRSQRKRKENATINASNGIRHLKVVLRMLSIEELQKHHVSIDFDPIFFLIAFELI